jgi:hypothetical protein
MAYVCYLHGIKFVDLPGVWVAFDYIYHIITTTAVITPKAAFQSRTTSKILASEHSTWLELQVRVNAQDREMNSRSTCCRIYVTETCTYNLFANMSVSQQCQHALCSNVQSHGGIGTTEHKDEIKT